MRWVSLSLVACLIALFVVTESNAATLNAPAPSFELVTFTGEAYSNESLKGRPVAMLEGGARHRFFPELWDIRCDMTDAWGASYGVVREPIHDKVAPPAQNRKVAPSTRPESSLS